MLKRIEWLKDCGHFSNFIWDKSTPEFKQVNVVFGANGAGKSSLAAAFDGLRNSEDNNGYRKVSVTFQKDQQDFTSNGQDDSLFDRVHVFSDRYIEKGHRFRTDPEMDAVLTIGEKTVADELQLERLKSDLEKDREKYNAANSEKTYAEKYINNKYREISESVVGAVGGAGGRWRSKSNFNAGVVRRAFDGPKDTWTKLDDHELRGCISLVNSGKAEALPEFASTVQLSKDLHKRLAQALETTPITEILDTLESNPEATSWVDHGRIFHADESICLFCAGPLDEARKSAINRHFSDAVSLLKKKIEDLAQEFSIAANAADNAQRSLPDQGLLFEDLRPSYIVAKTNISTSLEELSKWAAVSREKAEDKAQNVLAVVESEIPAPPHVDFSALVAVCKEHNSRVAEHEQRVKMAAESVELHYLKSAETAIEEQKEKIKAAETELARLGEKIRSTNDQIVSIENVEGDPTPTAQVLTVEVARLLGRNELEFEAVNGRYRVLRHGKPAVGLSTGERSVIMLIHFMESVARFNRGKPIVIIDDPVSSMDSNVFMGISTYLWSEVVSKNHIDQIILMTHNFELFRQWDIQMEGAGRHAPTHKFYEIKSRVITVEGVAKREPRLIPWPPNKKMQKKIRSSYHHAFIAVEEVKRRLDKDDSMDNRLDAQLLFPNVIRRILESFLAFKLPQQVGNLNQSMRVAGDLLRKSNYQGDADALRLRLTRYAHAYSHSESPATDSMINPDEVRSAIAAVFEFINALDPEHLDGLCAVLEVDKKALLSV